MYENEDDVEWRYLPVSPLQTRFIREYLKVTFTVYYTSGTITDCGLLNRDKDWLNAGVHKYKVSLFTKSTGASYVFYISIRQNSDVVLWSLTLSLT